MKKFNYTLDPEEQELLDEVERGEWKPVPNQEEEKRRFQESASYTLKLMEKEKVEKVTFTLSQMDIEKLKEKATKTGMTYQSLIESLIHKFLQRSDATV